MPIPFFRPDPAPPAIFKDGSLPWKSANLFSKLFFHWITPILKVGYSRPLEPDDLWELTDGLKSRTVADDLERHFEARLPPSRRRVDPNFSPTTAITTVKPVGNGVSSRPRTTFATGSNVGTRPRTTIGRRSTSDPSDRTTKTIPKSVWGADLLAQAGEIGQMLSWVASDTYPSIPTRKQEEKTRTTMMYRIPEIEEEEEEEEEIYKKGLEKKYGPKKAQLILNDEIVCEDGEWFDMSLWKSMYYSVKRSFWIATIIEGIGYGLQITAPLVTRLIIQQITQAHSYSLAQSGGDTSDVTIPPSQVYGIGLALGLFGMLWTAGLCLAQAEQRLFTIGLVLRTACIDLISRKSLRLSARARLEMTNGHLTNLVSADASYLEWAIPRCADSLTMTPQILVGIGLLIYTLGYSALVGLAVLAIAAPIQSFFFARMLRYRQDQQTIVDSRIRLLSEVITHIRSVKLYAYGNHFGTKVNELRKLELKKLKDNGLNRASMTGISFLIPMLAAILSFVTYSLTGHTLDAATIFTALQFFNILETPISFLPMILTALSDAMSAICRINDFLKAEEMPQSLNIDPSARYAISCQGDFEYDVASCSAAKHEGEGKSTGRPFRLADLDLRVPRGALVCVVGRVGTGKSALLSGLLGDMRHSKGETVFCDTVSYVPQEAWIMSGSIKDNITFGANINEINNERLAEVIRACGLELDIAGMSAGSDTKLGERGITLSGGQRQRLCLARAAYAESGIVLLDDPLSAVDAQVGYHLLHHCILRGPLAGRTRVLVTHQLDVLPRADWVVVLDTDNEGVGRIVQQGRYNELISKNGALRGMIRTSLAQDRPLSSTRPITIYPSSTQSHIDDPIDESSTLKPVIEKAAEEEEEEEEEERETGSIAWSAYTGYIHAMGDPFWAIIIFVSLILGQLANIGNSLMLGFWSAGSIKNWGQVKYISVYAGFGVLMATCVFVSMYAMILGGLRASYSLFKQAWGGVLRSPVGWHDRNPSGRILSRLAKDVQMMDDRLTPVWNNFLTLALSVVGTFALIVYTYPWLGLAFIPLGLYLYLAAGFYRQTSREVKRIDSVLRSGIYSKFGEQLTGTLVIRAFQKQEQCLKGVQNALDSQGRALILSITLQQWLIVRLDFMSQLLVLLTAIFGVMFRDSVDPAKFGVVLTYALATTTTLTKLVPLFAYCEQEMNNVERIQHYLHLSPEPPSLLPTDPTSQLWPSRGEIRFRDVSLRYRPELPLVLDGLNFTVRSGEKVGIIGRTGAGKSSITQALFRMVDIQFGGKIEIDGVDTMTLGLDTLRRGISIIPQEAFLFTGSIRKNLDPGGERTDQELNEALYRIRLLPDLGRNLAEKFKLDGDVNEGGNNVSAGERQLLALTRALVHRPKILVLDEATSSVDTATDKMIQRVVQSEFSSKGVTILSIAHRLETVAWFDKILVMDHGKIIEFDTPLKLFERRGSLFRLLCEKQHLTRTDLVRIRNQAEEVQAAARGVSRFDR